MKHFNVLKKIVLFVTSIFLFLIASTEKCAGFTFIHFTDEHMPYGKVKLSSAIAEVNQIRPAPAIIIDTGDFTELGFEEEYQAYEQSLKELRIPVYPLLGNHETAWVDIGKERFLKYYKSPYRSFDYDGIHFVLLDTSIIGHHHGHIDSTQIKWLLDDLAKVKKDTPILIFSHHPVMYAAQFVDNETEILKSIEPYNVRIWFCGHGHSNVRWNVNGIDFVMSKAIFNGGYRTVEINNGKVIMYTKELGKEKVKDLPEIDLYSKITVPKWEIVEPEDDIWIHEPGFRITAHIPSLSADTTLYYRLDYKDWQQMYFMDQDYWSVFISSEILNGFHQAEVKYTDQTNRTWLKTVNFRFGEYDAMIWWYKTNGPIRADPIVVVNKVFIGSEDGNMYCFNAEYGKLLWKYETRGNIIASSAFLDNKIYFGSQDHYVYCLNTDSGSLVWKHETGGPISAAPLAVNNKVYIGSSDFNLYCLDATTGNELWRFPAKKLIASRPAYRDGKIYFGCWDQYFRVLDAESGNLVWEQKIGRNFYFAPGRSSPVVVNNRIFFSAPEKGLHKMYALDISTGGIVWVAEGLCGYQSPTYSNGKIYYNALDGNIYALDSIIGDKIWVQRILGESMFDSATVVSKNILYTTTIGSKLYYLDAETGEKKWAYQLPYGYIFSSPAVDNDIVYVGSMNGCIYAIRW